uniref:DNA-directed RNA polymerase I subunit RPA12 isoform X2 n=1 Tax=Myxine glutinosa TaxID=7769 RepID=UPI00358DEC70
MNGAFDSWPELCPECGTVLPLPTLGDLLVCRRCGKVQPITVLQKVMTSSSVTFPSAKPVRIEDTKDEDSGLLVERSCKKCGHNQARYHTQQTRSADEGQTVFYACASCGFQEKEDS